MLLEFSEPMHTDLILIFTNKFENEFAEVLKLGWLRFLNSKIVVDFIPTFIIFFLPSDSL